MAAEKLPVRFIALTQKTPWRAKPTRQTYINLDRVLAIYQGDPPDHTVVNLGGEAAGQFFNVVETVAEIIAIAAGATPK
jgi:hypothetical protein